MDELSRRLVESADAFAEGAITSEQLRHITARLRPELDEAERRRAESVVALDLEAIRPLAGGPTAREYWAEMTAAQRRAVLAAIGLRVIVDRTRPGPGFDPTSVRFEWRR